MPNDLFETIQNHYDEMTKSFQKTADFIILMKERVLIYSANELASYIGVSDATIVRFSQCLGFEGYNDLKRALAFSLEHTSSSDTLGSISPQISCFNAQHEYMNVALRYEISSLERVVQNLKVDDICKVVDKIENANKLFCLGLGSSSIPALSIFFAFDRLQLNCKLLDFGGNVLMEKLAFSDNNDVLIAVSLPRYSVDTYNAMKFAKENGTFIVLISNGNSQALSPLADVEFVVPSQNPLLMYNSNVSVLALCNIIVLEFCYRHPKKHSRILKTITEKTQSYKIK